MPPEFPFKQGEKASKISEQPLDCPRIIELSKQIKHSDNINDSEMNLGVLVWKVIKMSGRGSVQVQGLPPTHTISTAPINSAQISQSRQWTVSAV